MAMTPRMTSPIDLYFTPFPKEWKDMILKLQLSIDPKFNTNYNLKTNVLSGYLNSWLDDVVQVGNMKMDSDDSNWMVSVSSPDTVEICEIIKVWIYGQFLVSPKKTSNTENLSYELLNMIDPIILENSIKKESVILFDNEGHALTDHAFNAFALLTANRLNGRTLLIGDHDFIFSSCGQKLLLSQPVSDNKKKPSYYAIGIESSLQTTPPERECMLLFYTSTKRFISNVFHDDIYLEDNIHSYVRTGKYKYRRLTLNARAVKTDDKYVRYWNNAEQQCYDLYHYTPLPTAEDVLHHPEQYICSSSNPQILLPYKNGMNFTDTNIGTGISVIDKRDIFGQLTTIMEDIATPVDHTRVYRVPSIKFDKPKEKESIFVQRRERLSACIDMPSLEIEIYGLSSDTDLIEKIKTEIDEFFGGSEYQHIFTIDVNVKGLGSLGDLMVNDSYESVLKRIDDVKSQIPYSEYIIGAIIILPNYSLNRDISGDPLKALRAGFADTNRLTQFITPDSDHVKDEDESSQHRAKSAVTDLLRQFGYTDFFEKRNLNKNPAFRTDSIGICVLHELRPFWAKLSKDTVRHLPIYITYNTVSGKLKVDCDLFDSWTLSYPQALIELSKISRKEDFVKKCTDTARGGIRNKLIGLKNLYHSDPALIMILANGTTRPLWYGITDKKISEYECEEQYVTSEIEIGTKTFSDMKSFLDTGLRIIRVRNNSTTNEVPDYFTETNEKGECRSVSGIFRHKNVFWGLENRPNNKEYTGSNKFSRATKPSKSFDECNLVEYYPVQLQHKDDAADWVNFANYLREIMPETSRSVRLPAPLHFGELMKEYLLLQKRNK